MALFVYLPIIAQITATLSALSVTVLGDMRKMPILGLLHLLVTVIVIATFGYRWGNTKSEERFGASYFVMLALPVYTLFCANLAFILSDWSFFTPEFMSIAFFSNMTFLFINFIYVVSGTIIYMFLTPLVSYIAFGAGFTLALKKKGLKIERRSFFILFGVIVFLALALSVQYIKRSYNILPSSLAQLEVLNDSEYVAYSSDTSITRPRGESTLKLQDNLPKLDGATALYPLYLSAYKAIYPEAKDAREMHGIVKNSTTPLAYENLIDGKTELIFVVAPSAEQLRSAKEKGVELVLTPIGKEAFVFLTNVANPVKSLSVENIREIYTGKVTNWRELGGENERILAFQRNENSGSQSAMEEHVMKGLVFKTPIKEEFYSSMGGMMEAVADYRNAQNAIGYSFRYYANIMNSRESVRLLAIEGIEPTVENIKNGSYPFSAEIYIVSTQNISENGKKLIAWFLSPQGQALVEDVGYVPVKNF
jgi:phosphate transport system substrate-binding protein